MTAAAPTGNASIALESSNTDLAKVPANVSVPAGETTATFTVDVSTASVRTDVTIRASYLGVTVSTVVAVLPPALVARFTVTSPSKGTDACSILNAQGNTDCRFDASQSEGPVSQFRWTMIVAEKEAGFGFPESQPIIEPTTTCALLSGATLNSNGSIPVLVRLQLQDRAGNQSPVTQKTIEITHNGGCGY